tara:strand:- start:196 stop:483 length:288 start_codon:yes stop_codon:yes gene_type:complete
MEHLKTKNQIKAMTQAEFQNVLQAHTDKNYHTENVVFIAMRYGYDWQIKKAEDILKKHLEIGYMTPALSDARSGLLRMIKAEMLPCHQQSIWECL